VMRRRGAVGEPLLPIAALATDPLAGAAHADASGARRRRDC
jgi:hypothetical protein